MKRDLTSKEQLVLYSLVRYPSKNDRELGEITGLSPSTVSTIKKRLLGLQFFTTINIPKINKFGYQLMTACYCTFNPTISQMRRHHLEKRIAEQCQRFPIHLSGLSHSIMLGGGKDFSDAISTFNDIERFFYANQMLESKSLQRIYFPFETSRINTLFDFAPMLRAKFNIGSEYEEKDAQTKVFGKPPTLKSLERHVLFNILTEPELNDSHLSQKIGVHRHTISKVRKKIEDFDLVKRVRIPNIGKLGYNILAFTHMRFKPETTIRMRQETTDWALKEMPVFLSVETEREAVSMYAFQNFDEYKVLMQNNLSKFYKNDYLSEKPETVLFSVNQINFFDNINFLPLMEYTTLKRD